MNGAQFRKAALALEGASENAHMEHPDFRVNGRIFATLSDGERRGMVKIPTELQAMVVDDESGAFTPAAGAWGRGGSTLIDLKAAPAGLVKSLLHEAWTLALASKPGRSR